MGVTFKRIAFGGVTLAAVLLPFRRPPASGGTTLTVDRMQRYDTLAQAWQTAHLAWSAFDLRDSALAVLTSPRAATGLPTIALTGFPVGTSHAEADSLVRQLWGRIGSVNPHVSTSILVHRTGGYSRPSYSGALITKRGATTECVAIAPASMGPDGRSQIWQRKFDEAVAPCALLATFGVPGTSVGAWLSATRFAPAQSNAWLVPNMSEYRPGPWIGWSSNGASRNPLGELPQWLASAGVLDLAMLSSPSYDVGAVGLRCLNGSQRDCVTAVLHPDLAVPPAGTVPADLTLSAESMAPRVTTIGTVRPPAPQMVAALITDFGRDRFQRFWSSNEPMEQAFQSAFGQSLGAWTAAWAARTWAGSYYAREVNADVLLGVTLKPSWLGSLLGWTALALAIAGWVARRRRV